MDEYKDVRDYALWLLTDEAADLRFKQFRNGVHTTHDSTKEKKEKPPTPAQIRRKQRAKLDTEFKKVRPWVLNRDGNRCVICGSKKDLEVHHIKPRSKGGKNEMDNLVTLCCRCHAEKHKGDPYYTHMVYRANAKAI